ncbi:MAG: FKBP-type peptidyl-prolyl cis-trans isomerase [Saprospiraceae bacterium]|jgi:FKBP-type peptidyl-prolyl cis-trans isomerase|nr:FKBP-type peptidyl-prolyl cis-trans isomerase [Saprospiraceae bacterium]
MKSVFSMVLLGIILLAGACKKDDDNQALIDKELIEQYLLDNNIDAQEHESGMFYVITTEGFGASPTLNDDVEVSYRGYFLDDTVFDQTAAGQTVEFPLANLIKGWQIGLPLLKEGGRGTFFLPSELGYGDNPPSGIPANAVLIFDIDLVDVK